MKSALLALTLLTATPASAQVIATLKPTPVGPPASQTLERLWTEEFAAMRNQKPPSAFHAWTFDAVFAAANGDKVVVSILQGPACDNGPNDKDAVTVPALCPARIARVDAAGAITAVLKLPAACNAGVLALLEPKNAQSDRTTAEFNATTGEITIDAIIDNQAWTAPIGPLQGCRQRRFI